MFSKSSTSHRRTSFEIVAEILKVAKKGSRKTRIVYSANLNFKMLDEYVNRLEEAGLLTSKENLIKTTDKGKEFLGQFHSLREFW